MLDQAALFLALAALLAGFVDALVGGGGLIQVPALFSIGKDFPAAALLGTNKSASVFGTLSAAWRYSRRVVLPWSMVLLTALAALVCSYLGAQALASVPKAWLRPLVIALLMFAAGYTFVHKDFGQSHQPLKMGARTRAYAVLLGAVIGFYDGFFGPGTGSFLIFLFVRVFGFDFLHASAAAKIVNVATNLAALAFFLPNGYVIPQWVLLMLVCNVAGAQLGSVLALRHGARLVRIIFLWVVCALIARLVWDALPT